MRIKFNFNFTAPAILAAHVTRMMCNPFVEQMVSPIYHLAILAAPAHQELKVQPAWQGEK